MISYFVQIVVFQLLVLGFYDLFLKRETFFQINRAYLLITPIVIMILPFLDFGGLQQAISNTVVINLPEVLVSSPTEVTSGSLITYNMGFLSIWLLGVVIALYFFIKKLNRIQQLKKRGSIDSYLDFKVFYIPDTDIAFTFMKSIFLGEKLSSKQKKDILLHEVVHAKQNHSIDLLFYEVLKIVFWFNPLLYIFQKRVAALQEFIADAKVIEQIEKSDYYENLLSKLFQTEKISFINTFFNQSLIKKRIVMLQKSKSSKKSLIKYLFIAPLLGAMIIYSSCVNEAKGSQSINSEDAVAEVTNIQKDKEINFKDLEKAPIYPGCENLSNDEAKKCFTQNVAQHVMKEFNSKISNEEIKGRQRIVVKFIIDAKGVVKDISAKADFKELQDEAVRVTRMLPKMIPGEHKGKKVSVQYALPILFEI